MDIPRIILVDFNSKKRRVNLPQASLNGPEIKRDRKRISSLPWFDLLIKQKSLEGIIQILKRSKAEFPEYNPRPFYYSGISPTLWCKILDQKINNANPFSDN